MNSAVCRLAVPLLGTALAAACLSPGSTDQVNIPTGAHIYTIAPQFLTNEFIDTTGGLNFGLSWLADRGFSGYNCLGFLPATPTDTVGAFVFGWAGTNSGFVQRRINGVADTVPGYFIDVLTPGTHGSYVVESSGKLTLNWSDGTRTRYFAPSAQLRMHGDTIESIADLKAKADSVRDRWHVFWIYSPACP